MSVVLLDTTVVSFLHPKKKKTQLRKKYEPHMKDKTLAISFQSVAELWHWAESNEWGEKSRQDLDAFLRRFLVIPYDYELAQVWARLMKQSKDEGRPFEAGDCWIAATAVPRNIPLLSHDRDFANRGIPELNVITYVEEQP